MKLFLCEVYGPKFKAQTTKGFKTTKWNAIRQYIDPLAQPDVIGTLSEMYIIDSGPVDTIHSRPKIEHLYPQDILLTITESLCFRERRLFCAHLTKHAKRV